MTQEATMIAFDDSDFMRNGDFLPTRLESQIEAVETICRSKSRHVENTVGLILLSKVEVLCPLTQDTSKIMKCLHGLEPKGTVSFCTVIKIAHLALRHRQFRQHKMRIVCFIGSPIPDDAKSMTDLAKQLKKSKVSVDVVHFEEDNDNTKKLSEFISILNGGSEGTSHLVYVPPGDMLSNSLRSSEIIAEPVARNDMDETNDPELLHALRISMEDHRMRQEREANAGPGESTLAPSLPAETGSTEEDMLRQVVSPPIPMNMDPAAMTEEEQIAYALRLSTLDNSVTVATPVAEQCTRGAMEVDQTSPEQQPAARSGEPKVDDTTDPEFLLNVMQSLPGVDPQNPEVRAAIRQHTTEKTDDDQTRDAQ